MDEQSPKPGGLLVPKATSKSSDSEDTRSTRSSASRGRNLIREISNRLRSTSSVSLEIRPLQEKDFRDIIDGWIGGFDKYNQLVTNQVSNDPSYPPEEFAKICKALTKSCGGGFVHGLPEALFDLALLWCPAEKMLRKPVDSEEPSWSWTGWHGAANFPFDPINCPDIRRVAGDFFRSEIKNFYIGPEASPYAIRREKKEKLRVQYPPYFFAPRGTDSTIESNTLRFEAQVIAADGFKTVQLSSSDDKEMACSELMDSESRHCGVIMDYRDLVSAQVSEPADFEFVLLSRNRRCEPAAHTKKPAVSTVHPPGTPVWNGERFMWDQQVSEFDEAVYEDGEWCMLNVMLIQHMAEGYAERVAIARIHEDAWKARTPTRKELILR